MDIVTTRGTELSALLHVIRAIAAEREETVHTLRVAFDDDGVKFKVNEGMWTAGYGQRGGGR